MGPAAPAGDPYEESDAEKAFRPSIAAAALRLLEIAGPNEAPDAVIDAVLRLGEDRRQRERNPDLRAAVHISAARGAALLSGARSIDSLVTTSCAGAPLTNTTQLEILGWSPGLRREDLDWVLSDLEKRTSDNARRLALDAALIIWRDNDKPDAIVDRIRPLAESNLATREYFNAVLSPPRFSEEAPSSESGNLRRYRSSTKLEKRNVMKAGLSLLTTYEPTPPSYARVPAPAPDNVDGRLFALWHILQSKKSGEDRYAIDSVAALDPIVGSAVVSAFRDALARFWRQWRPQLVSERAADKRNTIRTVDCMGITAVSVDAKTTPDWPSRLTSSEATRAAQYGTLELNGFPDWFNALATVWPHEVADVLMTEVRSEISIAGTQPIPGILQHLVYGPREASAEIFELLFKELQRTTDFPPTVLSAVVEILSRGIVSDSAKVRLAALALERFKSASDQRGAAVYLSAAFMTDPVSAAEATTESSVLRPGGPDTIRRPAYPSSIRRI